MNVRLRTDLQFTKRQQGLDPVWVIKDPVSFNHFLFSEQEVCLAKLIDGSRTPQEVAADWNTRFQTDSLSLKQVQQFVQRMISDNLVAVDQLGYGSSLVRVREQARRQPGAGGGSWLANPLAIRFRGVNPTVLLNEFGGVGRIAFHPLVVILLLATSFFVLLFLLANFEALSERIPAIEQLLSSRGLMGMVLTIAVVKLLHELGHALACRQFGGECFEIGVMLLALIPTLYCNVSDAWTIRERWKRMMVSFAGIYIEIGLAAVAAIAWMMTPPGLLNALLFNVVLLCSVNTILINGNPLLRYDGYYLLSDFLERPNLGQDARCEVARACRLLVSGQNEQRDLNFWLLVYGLLSAMYRWFVIGVILLSAMAVSLKWQAPEIGLAVCGFLITTMLMSQMRNKTRSESGKTWQSAHWIRRGAAFLVVGALLASVIFLPLPKSVYCELKVDLTDAVPLFAPADGKLVSIVEPYQSVKQGDVVARLFSRELEQQVVQQSLALERARNELNLLESRVNESDRIASRIEVAKKNVESMDARRAMVESELARLEVVAPISGVVFPAAEKTIPGVGEFDVWLVSVELARNRKSPVRRSEHLLTVGDPNRKQVTLLVAESEIGLVNVGQPVTLSFDRLPHGVFRGIVQSVLTADGSSSLSNSNESAPAISKQPEKTFRVLVELAGFPAEAVSGSTGRAKIGVASQTLIARLSATIKRAMNTRL